MLDTWAEASCLSVVPGLSSGVWCARTVRVFLSHGEDSLLRGQAFNRFVVGFMECLIVETLDGFLWVIQYLFDSRVNPACISYDLNYSINAYFDLTS